MSDKIIKLAMVLGVAVGISFSVMLIVIFITTSWHLLVLSGFVG